MSLFKCPECKNQISEYAEFCPRCGCPKDVLVKAVTTTNYADRNYLYCRVVYYNDLQKPSPRTYSYISDISNVRSGDIALVDGTNKVIIIDSQIIPIGGWCPFPPNKTKHISQIVGNVYENNVQSQSIRNNSSDYNLYSDCEEYDDYDDCSKLSYTDENEYINEDFDWYDYTGGESFEEFMDHENYDD